MKAVLVTGASTGIGLACTQKLANAGFAVYAGVRDDADANRLAALHENIRPLRLDVTAAEQVAAAASAIRTEGVPLRAVLNNAGIVVAGPLEYLPLPDVRRQFEVNVLGALAVTQAVLPLLRQCEGSRVLFMSSVSGQIAPPFLGPYAASKFAIEALADSLRMELAPFSVQVAVIQPGNVRTPIWGKSRAANSEVASRMPPEAHERYGTVLNELARAIEREEPTFIEADVVATVVARAVSSPRTKARYAIGTPGAWQRRAAALLPERLRDRLILRALRR